MSALAAVAVAVPEVDVVVGRLVALLRPEFNVAVLRPDPDDPVLAGARCAVGGCARRLGVPVTVGHHTVSFERIPQPWLRTAVKTWARARLVGGMSFGAIRRDTTAMSWFARWLADSQPGAADASGITRATLERYLVHLAAHGPTPNTRLGYLTGLRGFLETARRRGWLDLRADAALYHDDLPRRPAGLPRFVPEDVMAQLESEAALARLPDATTRHLVMVVIETGLRALTSGS